MLIMMTYVLPFVGRGNSLAATRIRPCLPLETIITGASSRRLALGPTTSLLSRMNAHRRRECATAKQWQAFSDRVFMLVANAKG
jgi:hypothetical protein